MNKNQLKFRTWNVHKQQYIQIKSLHFDLGNDIIAYDGNQYHIIDIDVIIELQSSNTDKNRHVLYEGDILKDTLGNVFIVTYWNNGFWLEPITIRASLKRIVYSDHCTLLGNVRENQSIIMEELDTNERKNSVHFGTNGGKTEQ